MGGLGQNTQVLLRKFRIGHRQKSRFQGHFDSRIAETKDLRLRSRRFAGWRSPSLSRGNAERKKNENDEYFGEDSQLCSSSFVVNS